jgi:putative aminopeptidase FrvX
MEDTLKRLVEAESISGFEKSVRDLMAKELKPYVDEIRVDKVGNLIARKGRGSPKVMVSAHMDEIGLMVKHIDEKGFLRFDTIGGWDTRGLPSTKVKIHGSKGPVIGVVGSRPVHLMEPEELKVPVKLKDMFIDIGAKGRKEAEKTGVTVGDFITRTGTFSRMVGTRVTGPGFDNRVGCTVLVEAVKRLKNFRGTLYAVGTIQEEMGLIGARGATFGINPDVALAIDTSIAGDVPEIKPSEACLELGKGPVLGIKDAITFMNPAVRKWLQDSAKRVRVNLQHEVISGAAAESSVIGMVREGIPSGGIFVTTRNIHSTGEVADMKDIEDCVKLVVEAVKSASKHF